MSDVAVVFLARGIGRGLAAAEAFFSSYAGHKPGAPHDLIVLRKGFASPVESAALGQVAQAHGASLLDLPDDGFDWGAYFRAASILRHDWMLLLNTHSRLVANFWLQHYLAAAKPDVGIVGATGTWQSIAANFEYVLTLAGGVTRNRTILHGAMEFLQQSAAAFAGPLLWRNRRFAKFPNIHVRSNAFLIRRDILQLFASQRVLPQTKWQAFELESGRCGLPSFVRSAGLALRLVGADGRAFAPEHWPESGTYSTPGQINLLVSDNQTRIYEQAARQQQQWIETLNWGRALPR